MAKNNTLSSHNCLKLARLSGLHMLPRLPESSAVPAADDSLEKISKEVHSCSKCAISRSINNYVTGEGNPEADVMFIGEAPGEQEDRQGKPFVGPAGELLTSIITKGMKIAREDVYIANILKCRPHGNRDPLPEECMNCSEYLNRQILLVRPAVIVLLGRIASQFLLGTSTPISALRGNFQSYMDIPAMPTFHPSYLLRYPSAKKDVWEDIKKVMTLIGLQPD